MKQMQWFRLYSEARTDAKLRSLPDDEFRVWFNLLCYASDQDAGRGAFDASDRFLIALECAGGDEDLLSRAVTRLSRLRILDDTGDTIRFINFEERQYDKPSDMPEQTRERKRKQRATTRDSDEQPAESREVTPRHAERREEKNREEKNREEPETAPARAEIPPFELVIALCDATGADVSELSSGVKGKQSAVAKRLRDDGMTPDDVRRCVSWLRSQSWRTNGVDLFTVEKERAAWSLAGKPAIAQANGRASPRETPLDRNVRNLRQAAGLGEPEHDTVIETQGVLRQ